MHFDFSFLQRMLQHAGVPVPTFHGIDRICEMSALQRALRSRALALAFGRSSLFSEASPAFQESYSVAYGHRSVNSSILNLQCRPDVSSACHVRPLISLAALIGGADPQRHGQQPPSRRKNAAGIISLEAFGTSNGVHRHRNVVKSACGATRMLASEVRSDGGDSANATSTKDAAAAFEPAAEPLEPPGGQAASVHSRKAADISSGWTREEVCGTTVIWLSISHYILLPLCSCCC